MKKHQAVSSAVTTAGEAGGGGGEQLIFFLLVLFDTEMIISKLHSCDARAVIYNFFHSKM